MKKEKTKIEDISAEKEEKNAENNIKKETEKTEKTENLKKKEKKKSKKGLIAGCIIIGFLLLIYFAGVFVFSQFFGIRTYINGVNVFLKNAEDVEEVMLDDEDTFTIIKRDGSTEDFSLDSLGYNQEFTNDISGILEEMNEFTWFTEIFKDTNIEDPIITSANSAQVKNVISEAGLDDTELHAAPTDAYLEKDNTGHYQIVEETEGDLINMNKAVKNICNSIRAREYETNLDKDGCYEEPEIRFNNAALNAKLEEIRAIESSVITVDMTGKEERLEGDKLLKMIDIDSEGNVTINGDELRAYCEWLEDEYDTINTVRKFHSTNQGEIEVGTENDTYGFGLSVSGTYEIIEAALLEGKSQTVYPSWITVANTRNDTNEDIGNTYIEISIAEQTIWYYINGELFYTTPCVTGMWAEEGRHTPTGVFCTWDRATNIYLDGSYGGESWHAFVSYWMGFSGNGCGLHDMYQPYYGGDRYIYGGSHGCVNLPYDAAKILYENTTDTTPVVIY